jgi:hypothetical protein
MTTEEATVKQKDARILREAVAHIANHGPNAFKMRALVALKQYALAVKPYCTHSETAKVDNMNVCIDCGHKEKAC